MGFKNSGFDADFKSVKKFLQEIYYHKSVEIMYFFTFKYVCVLKFSALKSSSCKLFATLSTDSKLASNSAFFVTHI
jgi:hypothetical protein